MLLSFSVYHEPTTDAETVPTTLESKITNGGLGFRAEKPYFSKTAHGEDVLRYQVPRWEPVLHTTHVW